MISGQCSRAPRMLSSVPKRGFFGIGAAKSTQVAIDKHVPDYVPHTNPTPRRKSETKVSTLSNGVKVASDTGYGSAVKVGVAVKAGSRYETVPGSALFLEKLAFKSTTSKSDIRVFRDLELIGATPQCSGDRDRLTYSLTVLPDHAEQALNMVGSAVCTPYLPHYEVHEAKQFTIPSVLEEVTANPARLLQEAIHEAAYKDNSALGHSYYYSDVSLIDNEVLRAFHKKQFTTGNVTVAGIGIEHERLVDLAESAFAELQQGSASEPPASPYKGGEVRRTGAPGKTHIAAALGAEVNSVKDRVALLVLKQLVAKASTNDVFRFQYVGTGLLGVQGSVSAKDAVSLASTLVSTLKKAGSPSGDALSAAKAKAKFEIAAWAGCRDGAFDQLSRSVLATGKRPAVEEVLATVDSVTASDIGKLMQGKISLATYGDLRFAPYLDDIKA